METVTSVRVYNNGDEVIQAVAKDDLSNHIEYNTIMRFGCALFIDGQCIHNGYLDKDRIHTIEELIKANPQDYTRTNVITPYK